MHDEVITDLHNAIQALKAFSKNHWKILEHVQCHGYISDLKTDLEFSIDTLQREKLL